MKPIIIDENTQRRLWRAAECAEHCGVSTATWRSYATRVKGGPRAVAELDARTPLFDAAEVQEWHAARPGRGARTDLADRREHAGNIEEMVRSVRRQISKRPDETIAAVVADELTDLHDNYGVSNAEIEKVGKAVVRSLEVDDATINVIARTVGGADDTDAALDSQMKGLSELGFSPDACAAARQKVLTLL